MPGTVAAHQVTAEPPGPGRERREGTEAAGGDGAPPGGLAGRERALVGLALVPLMVSAVTLALNRDGVFPTGDLATSELAVRDIGTHPVLHGLWSRADWSHPGPVLWYLLWPLYRLTGSTGTGLALGALVINGAAVTGIAVVARRRGGTALLVLSLLGCALLVRTLGAGFTASYWNLHITTLPFALLLFLVWSLACGDRWALPATALVATFLAQTHVGFVPVALVPAAYGLGHLVVATWRGRRPAQGGWRPLARPAAVATGLLVLLWLPPLVDAVTNSPSNARRIVSWFGAGEGGTHSLGESWRVVTGQFGLTPEWLVGKLPPATPFAESPFRDSAPLPVLLVAAALAGAVLWRRSPAAGRRLVTTLTVALVVSVPAIANTVGPLSDYRLRWTWVVPMVWAVAMAWAAWLAAEHRWPDVARRLVLPAAIGALLVVTAVDATAAARARTLEPADTAIMSQLTPAVLAELERAGVEPGDEVLVRDPFTAASWFANGLVLQLDRHGYAARVPASRRWQFGDHRVAGPDPDAELWVTMDVLAIDTVDRPGARLLARWSSIPLDGDGDDTVLRVLADVDAAHEAFFAGEIDVDELHDRLAEAERAVPTRGDMAMRVVAVYLMDR